MDIKLRTGCELPHLKTTQQQQQAKEKETKENGDSNRLKAILC